MSFKNIDIEVQKITSRVKKQGYGCTFTFNELQEWLGIKPDYGNVINLSQNPRSFENELDSLNAALQFFYDIYLEINTDTQIIKAIKIPHDIKKRWVHLEPEEPAEVIPFPILIKTRNGP